MSGAVAGIDPHQDTFTVGIIDHNGIELATETFANRAAGYLDATDLLTTHRVEQVGVEGTASWGQHVAIALVAAGFDVREVPAQRSAQQRRARRLAKTDAIDAVAAARALLAEPSLGPAQALEVYDPLVAKIEAVLEHRRCLVEARTLMLHYAQDQLAKLPTEIRDQLPTTGKIESRLRRLAIDTTIASTAAGAYRLSWLLPLVDQDLPPADRSALSNTASTSCSTPMAPRFVTTPGSARSPRPRCWSRSATRSASPASPSSPAGAAPALWPCPPVRATGHRSGTGSTSGATVASTACSTSPASPSNATTNSPAPTSPARPPKARHPEKPAAPTSAISPTGSSAACGPTNAAEQPPHHSPLDKGASDSPASAVRRPGDDPAAWQRERLRRPRAGPGLPDQPKQLVGDGDRAQSGFTRPHPLLRRVLAYLLLR